MMKYDTRQTKALRVIHEMLPSASAPHRGRAGLAAAALLLACAAPTLVTASPIAVTGWNHDIIAEKTAATPVSGTSTAVSTFVFYETGAPLAGGLPSSGQFASTMGDALTFEFQPYTSNNVLLNTGILTLTTPATFSSLAFLSVGQGLASSLNITLNFLDGTYESFSTTDPDWTLAAGGRPSTVGLAKRNPYGPSSGDYAGNIYWNEHDYDLTAAGRAKPLASINFAVTGGNEMIFAVNGEQLASDVPEPATLALLLVGVAAARTRRSRAT
jgi:hypothetical protein